MHQELNLFDNLDVAANVFFGREPLSFGLLQLVDTAAMVSRTKPLLERLGADFGPDTAVAALSLAQRQLVEIAKALSLGAEIVIMDEPTSSLTLTEPSRLLGIIAELKASLRTVSTKSSDAPIASWRFVTVRWSERCKRPRSSTIA